MRRVRRNPTAVPKLAPALILSVVACTKAPATFSGAPAFPASAGVQVLPSEVRVVFPATLRPDSAWPAQQLPDRFAGAAWQVLIRLDTTWLAAVHQLEPDSALLLPAFVSLDQAVGAGHLRACDLEAYLLVCFRPLRGSAALAEGRVVLHIQESGWTAALLRSRPTSAHLAAEVWFVRRTGQPTRVAHYSGDDSPAVEGDRRSYGRRAACSTQHS